MKSPLAHPRATAALLFAVVVTTSAVFTPDAQCAPHKKNFLTRLGSVLRVELPKPEKKSESTKVKRSAAALPAQKTAIIKKRGYRMPQSISWQKTNRSKSLAGPKRDAITVRTTAYTHTEDDHIAYANKNAIGTTLQYGNVRSAAADWSVYPLGTRFQIEGDPTTYVIDDYGSALVGTETIDLYKPSKHSMNQWGVRHVKIRVVQWGSYEKSLDMLKERSRYWHVRAMVQGLLAKTSLALAN